MGIENLGGTVLESSGEGHPARLKSKYYDLAMSRAMGDFSAECAGLCSEPEVGIEMILDSEDEHMILACSDGVWDVVTPQQAVQLVAKFNPQDAQNAVEKLVV